LHNLEYIKKSIYGDKIRTDVLMDATSKEVPKWKQAAAQGGR